jgi:hypothetical protein
MITVCMSNRIVVVLTIMEQCNVIEGENLWKKKKGQLHKGMINDKGK